MHARRDDKKRSPRLRFCSGAPALLPCERGTSDLVERALQGANSAIDVAELVEPEQAHPESTEVGRLVALQRNTRGRLQALRDEVQQLKDAIPDLEKKSIKRIKLAGTLTAIENESQKAKVKAALRRKKDLNRIDDFLVGAFRTLRALNQKTPGQTGD